MKIHLTIFILAFSLCAEAQPPGVKLPPTPIFPAPYDNTDVNPLRDWGILFHRNRDISKSHTFQVWLKDSSSLTVEGKIEFDSASYYLSWTDKSMKKKDSGRIKKIYPSQTRCISLK